MAIDFSGLTGAVDFSTVGTAILAIGAVVMVPLVVKWGTLKVLSMVGGGDDDGAAERDADIERNNREYAVDREYAGKPSGFAAVLSGSISRPGTA